MSTTLRKAAAVGGVALTLTLSAGAGSASAMRGPDDGGRSSADQKVADSEGHVYVSPDDRGVRADVPASGGVVLPAPNGVPGWMSEAVGGSALAAAAGLVVVAAARRRGTHLHSPA